MNLIDLFATKNELLQRTKEFGFNKIGVVMDNDSFSKQAQRLTEEFGSEVKEELEREGNEFLEEARRRFNSRYPDPQSSDAQEALDPQNKVIAGPIVAVQIDTGIPVEVPRVKDFTFCLWVSSDQYNRRLKDVMPDILKALDL